MGAPPEFFQQVAQDEGSRIVVGAIALVEVRHIEGGVLEDAGAIAHAEDVIEAERGQVVGPDGQRPLGEGRPRRGPSLGAGTLEASMYRWATAGQIIPRPIR